MCLIVDADVAGLVFANPPHADFAPVADWLHNPRKDGCIVFGGQLREELERVRRASSYLLELNRAGRARLVPDAAVTAEEDCVSASGLCDSDDWHVIALARVSGARTLCSHDRALQRDFRNHRLISGPRGSIYKRPEHERLLRHTTSCGRLSRRR